MKPRKKIVEIDLEGIGKYKGTICNDELNGCGEIQNENGEVIYKGGFKANEFDGFGILKQEKVPDGSVGEASEHNI